MKCHRGAVHSDLFRDISAINRHNFAIYDTEPGPPLISITYRRRTRYEVQQRNSNYPRQTQGGCGNDYHSKRDTQVSETICKFLYANLIIHSLVSNIL